MRSVMLLAVLALGCDQGATAAPAPSAPLIVTPTPQVPAFTPYTVRDDADFLAKVIQVIDGLVGVFEDRSTDCELVATRIERFGAENVTRFAVLTAYGKAHPAAEKLVQAQLEPRIQEMMKPMIATITACSSNQRLMSAFERLTKDANTQALQQRPH